jgi:hypothetical protein
MLKGWGGGSKRANNTTTQHLDLKTTSVLKKEGLKHFHQIYNERNMLKGSTINESIQPIQIETFVAIPRYGSGPRFDHMMEEREGWIIGDAKERCRRYD